MLAAIYSFLLRDSIASLDTQRAVAVAQVRTAIGTSPTSGRLFPQGILDEGCKLPAITYWLVDTVGDHNLDAAADGLVIPRFQMDVYGSTALEVEALCRALRFSLDGIAGALLGDTEVDALLWDNEVDRPEVYAERLQYCRSVDFRIVSGLYTT